MWLLLFFVFSLFPFGGAFAAQWRHSNHDFEQCFVNAISRSKSKVGVGTRSSWVAIDRISDQKTIPLGGISSQSIYRLSYDIHPLGDLIRRPENLRVVADERRPDDLFVLRVSLGHSAMYDDNIYLIEGRDYFHLVKPNYADSLKDYWLDIVQTELDAFHWVANTLRSVSPDILEKDPSYFFSIVSHLSSIEDPHPWNIHMRLKDMANKMFRDLSDSEHRWAHINPWVRSLGVRIDPYGHIISVSEDSRYDYLKTPLKDRSVGGMAVIKNLDHLLSVDTIHIDNAGWIHARKFPPELDIEYIATPRVQRNKSSTSQYIREGRPHTELDVSRKYPVVVLPHFVDSQTIAGFRGFLEQLNDLNHNKFVIRLDSNRGGRSDLLMETLASFIDHQETPLSVKDDKVLEKYALPENIPQVFFPEDDIQIVLITDQYTASAAEVFVSVLQYYYGDKVIVIGIDPRTIGKGTAIMESNVFGDRAYRYEVGRPRTPDGGNVEGSGVRNIIPLPDAYANKYPTTIQAALHYAMDLLSGNGSESFGESSI